MSPAIEKDIVFKRLNGIQEEISELKKLGQESFTTFRDGIGYKLAHFHLHRALEGVFHIGSHLLSRIPGKQASEYREIALKLGEVGMVDKKFAEEKLALMAKYRNRLVHFYAQISPKELYDIIHKDLGDFDVFLKAVKKILGNPEKFGLEA